jgi:hypothetical protein
MTLRDRNTDGIANLAVFVKNLERGHLSTNPTLLHLKFLLRVSIDYHNKGKEEQCARKITQAERYLLR